MTQTVKTGPRRPKTRPPKERSVHSCCVLSSHSLTSDNLQHPETQDNRAYSNTTDLPARDSAEKAKAGPISAGGSPAPPHPEPHINLPATDSSKHSSPQFSLVTPLPARDDAHAAQPESRPSDDSATKNPSMLDTITLPNSVVRFPSSTLPILHYSSSMSCLAGCALDLHDRGERPA